MYRCARSYTHWDSEAHTDLWMIARRPLAHFTSKWRERKKTHTLTHSQHSASVLFWYCFYVDCIEIERKKHTVNEWARGRSKDRETRGRILFLYILYDQKNAYLTYVHITAFELSCYFFLFIPFRCFSFLILRIVFVYAKHFIVQTTTTKSKKC